MTVYKITHYDYDCSPIFDGSASFFTWNIEDFQTRWFANRRVPAHLRERFLRSKMGKLVTDWYGSEDPKLNIVRWGKGKVYGEKTHMACFGVTEKAMDLLFADVVGDAG